MDTAAVFLAGSILYALGFLGILIAIVVANNIIHKFWKSFGWKPFAVFELNVPERRFITDDKPEPVLDPKKTDK
jgi:hypothetical protein